MSRRVAATALATAIWLATATQVAWADNSAASASEVVQLGDQSSQTSVVTSLIGDRTVVPGDDFSRTILVQNTADSNGLVSVKAKIDGSSTPSELSRALRVDWRMGGQAGSSPLRSLIDGDGLLLDQVPLGSGQSVPFTISLHLPIGVTGGNRSLTGLERYVWDVEFSIVEGVDQENKPTPTPTHTPAPTPGQPSPVGPTPRPPVAPLVRTGIEIGPDWQLLALPAALGFWLILAAVRRRRRQEAEDGS